MASKSFFPEVDSEVDHKLAKKAKDSPLMVIGMAGFVTAGLVGAYKYKNRGTMSTSVFLMQLRVVAQSMVVGCLTAGLAYSMLDEYVLHKDSKKDLN